MFPMPGLITPGLNLTAYEFEIETRSFMGSDTIGYDNELGYGFILPDRNYRSWLIEQILDTGDLVNNNFLFSLNNPQVPDLDSTFVYMTVTGTFDDIGPHTYTFWRRDADILHQNQETRWLWIGALQSGPFIIGNFYDVVIWA